MSLAEIRNSTIVKCHETSTALHVYHTEDLKLERRTHQTPKSGALNYSSFLQLCFLILVKKNDLWKKALAAVVVGEL